MSEGHFEAKLTAKRETAAGIYLTIQVQPDDYVADLATLRVGSALVLGWSEIVDASVQPIDSPVAQPIEQQTSNLPVAGSNPAGATKDRKPFASLPLSQQAALRCQDNDFKLFLGASNAEDAADILRKKCGISSRSELNHECNMPRWIEIERQFQSWLTDQRYAEARR